MRIIFIHGLGDTTQVFDELAPLLPGEHVFVDLWKSLGNARRRHLNIIDFCKELIVQYNIEQRDVIVGHSLGGWIAYHMKQVQPNRIIQIGSATQLDKFKFPIRNRKIIYAFARSGVLFSSTAKSYLLKKYRREATKSYYTQALDNLASGNCNCVVNQLRLIFDEVDISVNVEPDLRIHARRDNIVWYPNEDFEEVPGDHFCLTTHPKEVATAIGSFLEDS